EDMAEDIRGSVNPGLTELIDTALLGESGVDQVTVDGKEYYAAYAPLNTIGWTQITFASVDELTEPTNKLLETMEDSNDDMLRTLSNDFRFHSILLIIGLLAFMQVAIIVVSLLAQKRVRPIQKMTDAVTDFVGQDMAFEMKDVYRTGDEIEELAESFDVMSHKMKEYVAEIVENAAEKERAKAEMEAASQIQFKMLPSIEPDFHGKPGYELYAAMETAKEVGGDLYDFYYLDDDHLVITIGDVSGKGITAALFMALSKQKLKAEMILHNGNVAEAMDTANKRLCEESADAMFVTVWQGVLTLSTGELQFVNAGHMYAAVKRDSGTLSLNLMSTAC
ncbi:MAG: SpoIIE family protein phosphatase, partial [Butyrivibrio sp.]|nr:SpoIIE family protein phosphatase [Butyrivibrio sp.]